MLLDRAPAWDKHRRLSFFIGLFCSLFMSNVVINIETQKPEFTPIIIKEIEEENEQVPRTVQEKKKVPPPPPAQKAEVSIKKDIIAEIELVDDTDEKQEEDKLLLTSDPEDVTSESVVIAEPPVILEPPVETATKPNDEPVIFAERMPIFDGCLDDNMDYKELRKCSESKLLKFLYKHIKYPAVARELGVEGTVVAEFVVERDGSTSDIAILRSLEGSCDREVLHVLHKLPLWAPGKQNGRPVRVLYRVPVKFKLQ